MRRAAKRDTHETAIVKCLRLSGWSVEHLSMRDAPDLLLGKNGVTLLAEVKTGNKKLKPGQKKWHDEWKGSKPWILRDVEDVLALNRWATVNTAARTGDFFLAPVSSVNQSLQKAAQDLRQQCGTGSTTSVATPKRNGRRTSRRAVND